MDSVVVGDFDVVRVLVFPAKAYPELIVNANAILAGSIAFQCFEMVARWKSEFVECRGCFKLSEFAQGGFEDRWRKFGWFFTQPESLGGLVGKGLDH